VNLEDMMKRVENTIIYEQPLNERMRTFLRLEHLFCEVFQFGTAAPA